MPSPSGTTGDRRLFLRAGPLHMAFDVDTAFLRRIRVAGREAVRGIYAAVRDHEWATIEPRVELAETEIRERSFRLSFDAVAERAPVDFRWRGTVTGDEDGRVRYEMRGQAFSSFRRNRIGFCILHPVEGFAGTSCTVEHDDGSTEIVHIPQTVAPYQPVFDIRALTHAVDDTHRVEVRCEGDVFEMEDQRNWSDASFKTYCTPLDRPAPVPVEPGDTVEQAVTIRLLDDARGRRALDAPRGSARTAPDDPDLDIPGVYPSRGLVTLRVDDDPSGAAPSLGAYFSGREEIAHLPLEHLRVDVDASDDRLENRLAAAAGAARRLLTRLFISARTHGPDAVRRLYEATSRLGVPIYAWLLLRADGLATDIEAVGAMRRLAHTPVGGGTNAYFTELNRMPPPAGGVDFVTFSVNPQVHAFDELSMMETLPVQAALVRDARRLSGRSPVVVSPITLRPRFNPEAEDEEFSPETGYDPRQDEPFGAAWSAGSYIHLARAGTAVVSYFDVATLREPLLDLLRQLSSMQGRPIYPVHSSDEERVLALAVGDPPRRLLVVNLTPENQEASIERFTWGAVTGEETVDRVTLSPYEWVILEEGG